ncbi:MAG: 4-(cytidine 5'-diphospho)-2-C-methyl-D-erythritol kinase [Candidatus Methylacidiphilales bacterium]
MVVLSPAKVNLFLHVLGRREDGFHELETLMCPVSCFDTLEFEPGGEEVRLEIQGAALSAGPENLVVRAAEKIRGFCPERPGMRIVLNKRIPMGGGLAGGSSNAASTLLACNALWNAGLSQAELHHLAAELGSDVNLFLEDGPCLCYGRGENVRPVTWVDHPQLVLLNPGFEVPTPWAFQRYASLPLENKKGEAGRWTWNYRELEGEGRLHSFKLRNDLEPAVFSKYLWMEEAKSWLLRQAGCMDALMSGSGATLFALTKDEDTAIALERSMRGYFGENCLILRTCPHFRHDQPD